MNNNPPGSIFQVEILSETGSVERSKTVFVMDRNSTSGNLPDIHLERHLLTSPCKYVAEFFKIHFLKKQCIRLLLWQPNSIWNGA